MKALILAAGYATRLYPLTKEYPKSLLKIGKKFLIDYIIDKLRPIDNLDEIIVITNNKFISQFRDWSKKLDVNKPVSLIDDLTKDHKDRLGAIGDMYFAVVQKQIKDDLLVIGGDNLFDLGLEKFLDFAKANKLDSLIGVYNIKDKTKASKYGVVELDKENRVISFEEKPRFPKSTLIAMCLYYFPKDKLGLLKEYLSLGPVRDNPARGDVGHLQCSVSIRVKRDATGFYIDWLRTRCAVYGFVFKGKWYDIGDHKFYQQAKENFSK